MPGNLIICTWSPNITSFFTLMHRMPCLFQFIDSRSFFSNLGPFEWNNKQIKLRNKVAGSPNNTKMKRKLKFLMYCKCHTMCVIRNLSTKRIKGHVFYWTSWDDVDAETVGIWRIICRRQNCLADTGLRILRGFVDMWTKCIMYF